MSPARYNPLAELLVDALFAAASAITLGLFGLWLGWHRIRHAGSRARTPERRR